MVRIRYDYSFIILTIIYLFILLALLFNSYDNSSLTYPNELEYSINDLEKLLQKSNGKIVLLQKELDEIKKLESADIIQEVKPRLTSLSRKFNFKRWSSDDPWPHQIPVLVFVCNRARAIDNLLTKLLRYRSSAEKFPIIVSQDCDNSEVRKVIENFANEVTYIKHLSSQKAHITVIPEHKRYITYYQIARHYKLGLSYVFDKLNHSSAIIIEDDLDIAPDFFEYFSATRPLLDVDKTLYCVSAWNDNGKSYLINKKQPELLYRSDFFPGLGWMMTKDLWNELGFIWPDGFWDDWIRSNTIRKNRACIRPEISRTGMTLEGKSGASRGLFFTQHLANVMLNEIFVNFTKFDLRHLIKENYDSAFLKRVYSAPLISTAELSMKFMTVDKSTVRIQYSTLNNYLRIAEELKIMRDFKDGVPRTAYFGVVTCFINGIRIYIAPDRNNWSGYDPKWESPSEI
ncbi:putative alpha-1,3-mannosyl-glycoprotein 2-beta-N-acetylglucosaminyltransferase [Dirofilaria immitis]